MKILATRKAEQNAAAVDPWTHVHLSTGLALGLMDVPLKWAALASVAYEVLEQFFERRDVGQRFFRTSRPESIPNAIVDTVVFVLGHRLGRAWNETDARPSRPA